MGFKVQVNLPGPRNGLKKTLHTEFVGITMIIVKCWDHIGYQNERILFPQGSLISLIKL